MQSETTAGSQVTASDPAELSKPTLEDAKAIWSLVRESGTLDSNSSYAYLLLCQDFLETCLVTKRSGQLLGFVTGYVPPQRSDVIFIWQIAVAEAGRRKGLARRMLLQLVQSQRSRGARFLEATVAPSNMASRQLFESVAGQLRAPLKVHPCFSPDCFPQQHEEEELIRIGPFP